MGSLRRVLLLAFLPLLLLTRCSPSDMDPTNPILRHDPSELYFGDALQLAAAIRRGERSTLRDLVRSHPDAVNDQGRQHLPLLAWAIGHRDPEAVEILLSAGANPNTTMPFGAGKMSMVSLAASAEDPRFLDLLLAYRADSAGLPDTEPPLFTAIKAERYDRVDALLKAGADINQQDAAGKTPIMMMALAGDYPQVLAFARRGANPRISMKNGTTLERVITRFPAEPGSPQALAQAEILALIRAAL